MGEAHESSTWEDSQLEAWPGGCAAGLEAHECNASTPQSHHRHPAQLPWQVDTQKERFLPQMLCAMVVAGGLMYARKFPTQTKRDESLCPQSETHGWVGKSGLANKDKSLHQSETQGWQALAKQLT
jgi:hypothetical protein